MADFKMVSVGLPVDVAVDILARATIISPVFSGAVLDSNDEKFAETLRAVASALRLWQPGDTHGEIIFEAEGATNSDASLNLRVSIRTVSVRSTVARPLLPAPASPNIAESVAVAAESPVVRRTKRRVSAK